MALTPQDILDYFIQYVQNDIPVHLIYVPDMKLVDRYAVQEFFLPSIEAMTETTITERLSETADRESVVRQLVRETVQYAIFSHRWLPRGEPTFKDMTNGTTVAGPGLEKLSSFCKVVASSGITFAWSDTCCIDKTSSVELEEAIRSMFRWYRNAAVCIVHLAQTTSLADMERDEWFERGWTLQELLAPSVSKFFNVSWEPLTGEPNDKGHDQVLRTLSAATGCPKDELCGFTPGPYAVDQRMSWAARRKTTRAEDMAYSLMGIFDVTHQPAYGEGAERSFSRLVELIMLSNGSVSVLNWAGKAAASHSSAALPSSPRCYLGHPEALPSSPQSYLGQLEAYSNQTLDLRMTSWGLQIPLVLLPVTPQLQVHRFRGPTVRVIFFFTDAQLHKEIGRISIDISAKKFQIFNNDVHYSLGVFNYASLYGNQDTEHPALRRVSTAYLLSRRKRRGQAQVGINNVLKVQDDLGFYGWKKVSTVTFVHFTLKSLRSREVMVVDKARLEVLHL